MSLSSIRRISHTDNPSYLPKTTEKLTAELVPLFGQGGPLTREPEDPSSSAAQWRMVEAVAQALVEGGDLAVEAGTGVGKTWAYLAPLLVSRKRAWISTATQALQDQLFQRDIPTLSSLLGVPVRTAMLKGRSSYVCLQRVDMVRSGALATGCSEASWLAAIEHVHRWANQSLAGDLAELVELDERSPLRPWISSSRDNCLGDACPRLSACHVVRARHIAMKADWVVINHHLFVASQRDTDDRLTPLLPPTDAVVFDEAHRMIEIGEREMGSSIGSDEIRTLAREIATLGPLWAKGLKPWSHLALVLEQAASRVQQLATKDGSTTGQSAWSGDAPEGLTEEAWHAARMGIFHALTQAAAALKAVGDAAIPLQQLAEHTQETLTLWRELLRNTLGKAEAKVDAPQAIRVIEMRWLEWSSDRSWRIVRAAPHAHAMLQNSHPRADGAKTRIFTSATLGVDEALTWFVREMGLNKSPELRKLTTVRIPSPFNYASQAALYVPEQIPEANEERHSEALAQSVAEWAKALGGRTLVLTTSLRACRRLSDSLTRQLSQGAGSKLRILAQGEMSRRALLQQFREAPAAARGAIMVASVSFWEGVDLPGDTLQLLVIDKLPFPSPGDPLTRARVARAKANGLDAFQTCFVDRAALALKQGIGRLIRRSSDKGVLVIADRRLLTQNYGPMLMAALPPMPLLASNEQLMARLKSLAADSSAFTKSSTKDPNRV